MNDSEKAILKALLEWNYNTKRSSAFNISMKTGYTLAHTFLVLRKFSALFWTIRKKVGKSSYYIINPKLKKQLLKELKSD